MPARAATIPVPLPSAAGSLRAGRRRDREPRIKRSDLVYLLQNLTMLIENGLSLAKSLAALAQERTLRKCAGMLDTLRRQVESGVAFSTGLAAFPATFSAVLVHQVRVGERAGTLPATLGRLAEQVENANRVRSQTLRKLAYPIVLLAMGTLSVTFMLLFVVPIFDRTYAEAKVPLPWVTRALIGTADLAMSYGWLLPLGVVAAAFALKRMRRNADFAMALDRRMLSVPLIGDLLRNVCVLQFMDVLGNLLESGFTVVEGLGVSSGAVGNRAMRKSIENLQGAVMRGERFSKEMDRMGDLFPPLVQQLIVTGERTGALARATAQIRGHLKREIDRRTAILVGTIEPILTIGLAAMIGIVLLAIYLPMFDMIGVMHGQ